MSRPTWHDYCSWASVIALARGEEPGRGRNVPAYGARSLERRIRALACFTFGALSSGCASQRFQPLHPEAPLVRDPDRRPFDAELEEAFSPKRWNQIDNSVVRPIERFFAVRPGGEAVNVNALDEVPDSSWFESRIGRQRVELVGADRSRLVDGPCVEPSLTGEGPWSVVQGKPNGAEPGFVIETKDGRRYLIKLDEPLQGVRASAADVVASRIYHAAGFNVPCNSIVSFRTSILKLAPDARTELATGEKIPFTTPLLRAVLARGTRDADHRYRAAASLYLDGRPLGPWSYHGLRAGDRNDVVPHDDRRELRASRLLAAWTDHSDQNEQNTLAMWITTSPKLGFVRHHLLDFGDCFGSLWEGPAQQAWRREYAYWFEPWQIAADFLGLGLIERPWDRREFGLSGLVFGYYAVHGFDPASWRPSFPNAAFIRMTERDAAWMARIIARFDPALVETLVATAKLEPALHSELVRILLGRRRAILERYLTRLSPLADPEIAITGGQARLCATDLAVIARVAARPPSYSSRVWQGPALTPMPALLVERVGGRPCVTLPALKPQGNPRYWVIELASAEPGELPYPVRFHLYSFAERYLLVGLERPESFGLPG